MLAQKEAVKQNVDKLADRTTAPYEYKVGVLAHLRKAISFDAACVTSVDPQTLLSTGAFTEDAVESIHSGLFDYEYFHNDFIPYQQLVKAADPVATLSEATNIRLERSARYRNVLRPAGLQDELRAALLYKGACWGYMTLFRQRGRSLFDEEERAFISSLTPAIARGLRAQSLMLPAAEAPWMVEEPGILVLAADLAVVSSNAVAEQWLTLLRKWERIDSHIIPRPIRAVCTRALAEEAVGAAPPLLPKVRIRMPNYPFLSIRASVLNGSPAAGRLAVWFELAKPADTLALIVEAYGLSDREKQILDQIVRGASTKEIAHTLHISSYTVQDHLKSIFAKTGVASRRELLWQLFSRYSVG